MSDEKLIVTKSKLDALATSISAKSGVAAPMTIAQMKTAVDGIAGGTITQDEDGYLVLSEGGQQSDCQLRYSIDNIFGDGIDGDIVFTGTSLNFPLAYQTGITSFTADNVTSMPAQSSSPMFKNCTNLSNISMKNFTYFFNSSSVFENCTSLETITSKNFPNVTSWYGNKSFKGCTNLRLFCLPKLGTDHVRYLHPGHFESCTNLEIVDMAQLNRILGNTFLNSGVQKIIIRVNTVATLDALNAFNGTPFASGGTGGTLYVPSALISSYESATNWSTILSYENNQILPIEGSQYETQYADGTPISS